MKSHICSLLAAFAVYFSQSTRAESIWIESESARPFPSFATTGSAKPEWVSGEKVLSLNLNQNQIEEAIPETGLVISHPFTVKTAGEFSFWNRVVFENGRAPFEWRVNQGEWTVNSQEAQPISNVQELAFWNPIGWTPMGKQQLSAGSHTLEIRLRRDLRNQDQKEIRYLSDVIHITSSPWRPHYRFRPGQVEPPPASRFELSAPDAPRVELDLTGAWHFAPYDEFGEISEDSRVSGTRRYPDTDMLTWSSIPVPSDRNEAIPEARFAHRFVLRTTVDVPEAWEGAGFQLEFEALNMISSLFVNGDYVGEFAIPKSRWVPDVSSFLRTGSNEIVLVVKDSYYGLAPHQTGPGMRRSQYFPESLFTRNQGVNNRLDFPVANGHGQAGILDTARLIATRAPVYVADTFVKPFPITRREIEMDTSLFNAGDTPATVTLGLCILDLEGAPVKSLGEVELTLPATSRTTHMLTVPSEGFTLWEIFDPHLYQLEAVVTLAGKPVDRHLTRFGVREWEVRGNQFYLNGIRRHLRCDLTHYNGRRLLPKDRIVSDWQEMGVNMFRRRFQFPWNGLSPRGTLNWMDDVGMPVRMNAATFDGQVASYRLAEGEGEDRRARRDLFDRWHAQMMNGVDTFKNHPSVFIWELDNEIVYINGRNFGVLDHVEPEFTKTSNAILAFDPTRSTISGGGNALRDDSLPTYGVHYFEDADRHYPDEAYTGGISIPREGTTPTRVWPLDFDAKPTFFSETAFLPGRNPAQFAAFGGEITFLGKSEAKPAIGLYASWIAEGYRWKGYAANHVWFSRDFTDGSYIYAWQPVAILRREWNKTFAPGQVVTRSLRVYNDLPDTRPITATWTLELDGKTIRTDEKTVSVAPGSYEAWVVKFEMPASTDERTEGRLILTASRAGEEVFTHDLPVTLIPDPKPVAAPLKGDVIVWDPGGETLARLRTSGYPNIREIESLDQVPDQFGLLVVGRNALSPADATNRRWTALAANGNKVLFFEQENPLHFQGIPSDIHPTDFDGRMAFSQNPEHPAFAGLEQDDLSLWSGDHVVYRNALRKPTRGATSLVQVDDELGYSAMLEAPVDQGLLFISQMAISEKLASEVVARRLFDNLVRYAATYRRVTRPVATVVSDPFTAKTLSAIGVPAGTNVADPVAALQSNPGGVTLLEGSAATLSALAAAPDIVDSYTRSGGYILILNLTPESLASFNQLVGYEHILRKFGPEKVQFPPVRNPLTAGLTLTDVVMSSGRRIQTSNRDEWPTDDSFDYIVDLRDIAPFATFPTPAELGDSNTKGPGTDRWPLNMVNGYTTASHWRMAYTIWVGESGPKPIRLTLPREEVVTGLSIIPTRIYNAITKLRLVFNDDPSNAQEMEIGPGESITVDLIPRAAKSVTFEILDWSSDNDMSLVGIDNFSLHVQRPDDFDDKVRPMLNIGGLIEYPRNEGGILLSQYVFRPSEANPVNAEKKKTLLSTLLKNLGVNLGGAKTAVAGFNLRYTPLALDGATNLYLSREQGWSAADGDLSALPKGRTTFADVRYLITDFTTSPLESAVTLQHPRLKSNADAETVTGIPVNAEVDTLFFLHSFLETRKWTPRRETDEPPVLFQYTVHYEDGSETPVIITLHDGVGNWLQPAESHSLPNAEIAWRGPDIKGKTPTLYQYQWNNPFPAKKVASVDLGYAEKGKDWGAPVLLGLTVARVNE